MKKTIIAFLAILLIHHLSLKAQVKFGTTPTTINVNSLLELESTNKGLLLPRIALTATNSASPLTAHVAGMVVYNTASAGTAPNNVTPGYYYNDGSQWIQLSTAQLQQDYDWRKAGNLSPNKNTDTTAVVYHMGSTGIGLNNVDMSAILQLNSSTQGFLPPSMSNVQAKAISKPQDGLLIYNTTLRCIMTYVDSSFSCMYNSPSVSAPAAPLGSTYTTHYNGWSGGTYSVGGAGTTTVTHTAGETFDQNTTCASKYISAQGCGGMSTVTGPSGTVYNLVDINGQCWTKQNMKEIPSNFWSYTPRSWLNVNSGSDLGYWGYYNTGTTNGSAGWGLSEPAAGEGLLYQWSAAMDNSLKERSRGVCPTGFHIPSDCEWMYLEHGLGMSLACQTATGWRCNTAGQGNVGDKIRSQGTGWNNASGFSVLLTGYRNINGTFSAKTLGYVWTSSLLAALGEYRGFSASKPGVERNSFAGSFAYAFSVRCLKD